MAPSEVLEKNYHFLMKNLLIDEEFLAYFISGQHLTDDHREKILLEPTKSAKASEFITILRRRGNDAYTIFLEALTNTGQGYIKGKLQEEFAPRDLIDIPSPVEDLFERAAFKTVMEALTTRHQVIIVGLIGAGKTQASRAVAESFKQNRQIQLGQCAQINSSTEHCLINGLQDLARALDVAEMSTNVKHLLKLVVNRLQESGSSTMHLLVFDNMKREVKEHIRLEDFPDNVKIIVTTNDKYLWPRRHQIEIGGLKDDEVVSFFRHKYDGPNVEDADILELSREVNKLVLGLACAKVYIQNTHCTIQHYIRTVKTRYPEIINMETKIVPDYHHGLLAALQEMICVEFKNEVGGMAFEKFKAIMFLDPRNIPEDLLLLIMGNDNLLLDKIVYGLQRTSLGIVSHVQGKRMMELHQVVQLAWRLLWSCQEYMDQLKRCLAVLNHTLISSRLYQEFNIMKSLFNHVDSAVSYSLSDSSSPWGEKAYVASLQIHLLNSSAYMYTEMYKFGTATSIQNKLFDMYYRVILQEKWEEVHNLIFSPVQEKEIEAHANCIIDKLIAITRRERNFLTQLCNTMKQMKYKYDDVVRWNTRLKPEYHIPYSRDQVNQLTPQICSILSENGLMLSGESLEVAYLVELLTAAFYTTCRLFHYEKNHQKITKETIYNQLLLKYHLCRVYEARFGKRLYHMVTVERYGLLPFRMIPDQKTEEISVEDLRHAIASYRRLYEDENDYYVHGILKQGRGDSFHQAVCLRQLLKVYVKLDSHRCNLDDANNARECCHKLETMLEDPSLICQFLRSEGSFRNAVGQYYLHLEKNTHKAWDVFYTTFKRDTQKMEVTYIVEEAMVSMIEAATTEGSAFYLDKARRNLLKFEKLAVKCLNDSDDESTHLWSLCKDLEENLNMGGVKPMSPPRKKFKYTDSRD